VTTTIGIRFNRVVSNNLPESDFRPLLHTGILLLLVCTWNHPYFFCPRGRCLIWCLIAVALGVWSLFPYRDRSDERLDIWKRIEIDMRAQSSSLERAL